MAKEALLGIASAKHLSVIMIQLIGTPMQDIEKIQQILLNLSQEIAQICPDQKISLIVKAVDALVGPAMTNLYLSLEQQRAESNETKKHGHCC